MSVSFRSASLATHAAYLKRDGVTRSGEPARIFDANGDEADDRAFAERCADDRQRLSKPVAIERPAGGAPAPLQRTIKDLGQDGLQDRLSAGVSINSPMR